MPAWFDSDWGATLRCAWAFGREVHPLRRFPLVRKRRFELFAVRCFRWVSAIRSAIRALAAVRRPWIVRLPTASTLFLSGPSTGRTAWGRCACQLPSVARVLHALAGRGDAANSKMRLLTNLVNREYLPYRRISLAYGMVGSSLTHPRGPAVRHTRGPHFHPFYPLRLD